MFLGGTGSWHLDGDDPDFAAPPATHDHSSHHEAFRTPATDSGPTHCAICHWLQLFRASAMRQVRVQFAGAAQSVPVACAIPSVRSGTFLDVPSRAPPA
jgi:hypothetical protein